VPLECDAVVVLAVDVGGSHVKARHSGSDEERRFKSGRALTAQQMAEKLLPLVADWMYDAVSIGVPAQVHGNRVVHEPVNLGSGWAGFDFERSFGRPTKVVNDAAMQAVGSYDGGRMLFLGLGTGLGSTMIVDGAVEPMELGHLPWRKKTYEEYVGAAARARLGKKRWQQNVSEMVEFFRAALEPDYVVLGGGEVEALDELPEGSRRGDNVNAFRGGFLLWDDAAGFRLP
jgi:predicted NBD/HSP70 family sugar kinase